jgi:outer membrane biosynthesis protein TonB
VSHGRLRRPMMEPLGFCEKHQLPLDRKGECELCRLSEMPSPPSRSAWWAVIIPIVLVLAGIAWAMSLVGTEPGDAQPRGVRTTTPQPASPPPTREELPPPEPVDVPEPPPVPGHETLAPQPGSEGTKREQRSLEPETANEKQIPDGRRTSHGGACPSRCMPLNGVACAGRHASTQKHIASSSSSSTPTKAPRQSNASASSTKRLAGISSAGALESLDFLA